MSDNAAGGKHRHVSETQSRVQLLSKLHRLILNLAAAAAILAPLGLLVAPSPAQAASDHPVSDITRDVINFFGFGSDQANNPTDPQPVAERPRPELTPREIAPAPMADLAAPPRLPDAVAAAPSVETPLHRLFCVEYARMRSGLEVFGDARHWWDRAKNLYARVSHPVEEAVMVFSGSKRLKRGHVAVVTEIVSPRQILVDQANWQNRGEIDHATPVLDVSAANDWSQVRVWDMRSGTFGSHVYAISGFIAKGLTTASRD
jgi:CHAP domain